MKSLAVMSKLTPGVMERIDTILGNRPYRSKNWGRGRERTM